MQKTNLSLPISYVFKPSDSVLIFYLHVKISNFPLPFPLPIIPECDLYGPLEPSEIWTLFDGPSIQKRGEDLYFFTPLKKKSVKGSRISRKVGSGAWLGEDGATEVVEHNQRVGSKKRFRYENKDSDNDGGWIMHEYTLDSSLLPPNQPNDYVLCRIRKNQTCLKKKNKKRKLQIADCEVLPLSPPAPTATDKSHLDPPIMAQEQLSNPHQSGYVLTVEDPRSTDETVTNWPFVTSYGGSTDNNWVQQPKDDDKPLSTEVFNEDGWFVCSLTFVSAINNTELEPPIMGQEQLSNQPQSGYVLTVKSQDPRSTEETVTNFQFLCELEHNSPISDILDVC